MNPVIKFTTLFGLLAVELAVNLTARNNDNPMFTQILALVFFLLAVFFVWRSFHGMRIGTAAIEKTTAPLVKEAAGN
jgi:K(+)-stimulated pyrophosphate-energized sodium pump